MKILLHPAVLALAETMAAEEGITLDEWISDRIRERMATQTGAES